MYIVYIYNQRVKIEKINSDPKSLTFLHFLCICSLKVICRRDIKNTTSQCLIPDAKFVILFLHQKKTSFPLRTVHSLN